MRRSDMSSLCCDWPCQYPQVNVRLGGGCKRERDLGDRTRVSTQHTLIFNQTIPSNSKPYREWGEEKESG